ncbi:Gfo/Idh/MocA family oxidoreductase [Mycetocola sp. 2940]|uniref:Gfo/Idh/MocA family protein n=1 Tax=Mycetocola sp. 2940 TaxID=3156452 RepID=UPI0033953CBA
MKNLNVALIGGGFMGRAHSLAYALAPIASDIGATVVRKVLVDVDEVVAAASAAQLGWEESATDWRQVIARDDIDIVDICTPPQLHQEIALAAIAAGKHVFCEKPITNSSDEGEVMAEAARAAGVVAQVGFNYRHTPAITFTKNLLDDGALGVPLQFRASYLQETGFTADPNRWRATKATGGSGTAGDIGSHIVDIGEYLLGDITRVCALLRSKGDGTQSGWVPDAERVDGDLIDDGGVWLAQFASGAIGTFAVSSFASGRKNRVYFELDGSKGATQFDWNRREEFTVSYVDEAADHRGFRTIHTNSEHPDGFWKLAGLGTGYVEVSAIQFQKFVRAITTGETPQPSFTDAVHVQRVIDAVALSAETGAWVDVPAKRG